MLTWYANSCVGVKTNANIPYGSSAKCWIIGRAKANVFPEPVLAAPIQSLPAKICGIQAFWIGVGNLIPEMDTFNYCKVVNISHNIMSFNKISTNQLVIYLCDNKSTNIHFYNTT